MDEIKKAYVDSRFGTRDVSFSDSDFYFELKHADHVYVISFSFEA